MNLIVTDKMKNMFSGSHSRNRINGRTALNSQNETTPVMARLWVIVCWYRSWRRMTKNLSALKATMLKNEANVRNLARPCTLWIQLHSDQDQYTTEKENLYCQQGYKFAVAAPLTQHQGRRQTYLEAVFSEFFSARKDFFSARVLLKRLAQRR